MYHIPVYKVSLVREGSVAITDYPILRTPEAGYKAFREYLEDNGREQFVLGMLNIRRRLIGMVTISVGCLTGSVVHPREVFGPAIEHKSAAIVVAHNHPSGDPEPSAEDLALTRRLATSGQLLGIELLDHVILGDGSDRFVSLKERGML